VANPYDVLDAKIRAEQEATRALREFAAEQRRATDEKQQEQRRQREQSRGPGALASAGQAAGAALGAFGGIAAAVQPFVKAFAPATVELFQLALYDLTAVIGSALQPVLEGATEVVRAFADALLPAMQELRPAFQVLTDALVSLLVPAIDIFMGLFQSLVPVLQLVAELFAALAPLLRVSQVLMAAWVEVLNSVLASLFGGADIKGAMDQLREGIQQLAKWTLLLVGYFARLVGATTFLNGLIKGLGGVAKKASAAGTGAARNAQFQGASDFGRSVALAAFTAQGAGRERKTQEDYLKETVEQLKAIRDGRENAVDQLIAKIRVILKEQFDRIVNQGKEKIHEVGEEAKKRINDSLPTTNFLADPSGAILRGLINHLGLL
jgi:hypothetical protein